MKAILCLALACLSFRCLLAGEAAVAPARTIPLPGLPATGKFSFAVADLDGDGDFDFVVRQLEASKDPANLHWKPSAMTPLIRAYSNEGEPLWSHDMGTGIEDGLWYAPVCVYDADQDGAWEVFCKGAEPSGSYPNRVLEGEESLLKLDPATGEAIRRAPYPPRIDDGRASYNNDSRNIIFPAYLDGESPSIIALRGTYATIQVWAYDSDLSIQWTWSSRDEADPNFRRSGAHAPQAADVDGDGRDELVIGSAVVDENGVGLWAIGGTVDACYPGDILWERPGMELFLGNEDKPEFSGLFDAATGAMIWSAGVALESQGLVADVDPALPGLECYALYDRNYHGGEEAETDGRLYSAQGALLAFAEYGLSSWRPMAAWWDGTIRQSVLGRDGTPEKTGSTLIADIEGDWREEILIGENGAIAIYSPPGEPLLRPPSPMTLRHYRQRLATGAFMSGYQHRPILDRPLQEMLGSRDVETKD